MEGVGGTVGGAIEEVRHMADSILRALDLQNEHLAQLVKPKPVFSSDKFLVISEAVLSTYNIAGGLKPGKLSKLFTSPAGVYTRINHWAYLCTPDKLEATYGAPMLVLSNEQSIIGPLDIPNNAPTGGQGHSEPNDLVIPPFTTVAVTSCLNIEEINPVSITLSTTTLQLKR